MINSRLKCLRMPTILLSLTGWQAGAQETEATWVAVIQSGEFESHANTLLADQPMFLFAFGVVAQAQLDCGFQSSPYADDAFLANSRFFLSYSGHLKRFDEHGRSAPSEDAFVVLGRLAALTETIIEDAKYMSMGKLYVASAVSVVGCVDPGLVALIENSDAFVSLGTPEHSSGISSSTLVDSVHVPGESVVQCHYLIPEAKGYTVRQDHIALDQVNVERVLNQIDYLTFAKEIGDFPFLRASCARNIDPDRTMQEGYAVDSSGNPVPEEEAAPEPASPADSFERRAGEPLNQEMARYYLDVVLTREPDENLRAEIVSEIEGFEGLEISPSEVTARARVFQEKGLDLPFDDYCFFGDNNARREAFHKQYGHAFRVDHLPHPLQEADFSSIGAYITTSAVGRGAILRFQGRAWRWDGAACVQGTGVSP